MIVHVIALVFCMQVVGSSQQYNNFYVTRARQELHLHNYYANSPTGVYCCDVQSVNGSGNITAEYVSETNYTSINSSTSKCVGLYTYCEYEPCIHSTVCTLILTYIIICLGACAHASEVYGSVFLCVSVHV